MWDLTVPGNNDHDFYVLASGEGAGQPSTGIRHVYNAIAADTSVLVHNCDEGGIETSFSPKQLQSKFKRNWIGGRDFGSGGPRSGAGLAYPVSGIQGFPWKALVSASSAPSPWRAAVAR